MKMNQLFFLSINMSIRIYTFIRHSSSRFKTRKFLLTKEQILKIIDFRLNNYFKENQNPFLSKPCGSPCYASPEMVDGKKYDGFKIVIKYLTYYRI